MSDFKIIGNANPVVGVVELYTVNNLYPKISVDPNFNIGNASSLHQIKWEVYMLELGKWRKTKENDKTGNQVTYKFRHGSLTRAGIRIVAIKGDEIARLDIKPLASKLKIDDVKLLDKNGKKIEGRLSYGQTVKARVHCLHMEKRRVYVTLWEDDVKGAGHNKGNGTNFIETKSAIVRDGIADIDFLLKTSFVKNATKNGSENDNVHEYYVTAQLDQEKVPSNNVNVNAPEAPTAPYKAKTTPKKEPVKSNAPVQQPKTKTSETPKAVKGKINSVNITDTAGHQIKGTFKEKQIKVWINSTELKGKEVRLKLFDDDYGSDDLLLQKEFKIQSDLHIIVVSLDTIPRSSGDNFGEGNEQELFAEIEVLQTHDFVKSAVVDVDTTVFKQDPFEVADKVMKVGGTKRENKQNNCGEKYCIKKGDKSELIREVNIRLAGFGGNVPTDEFTDRTEKMIKQFQRDYMQVPETGKICGNILKAIDEFQVKYIIHFDDIKCKCKKCTGFGNGLYKSVYVNGKPKEEAYHHYEYPGIHRSLVWSIRSMMFYSSVKEKLLGYEVKCIFSGYRCWEDNKFHGRNSTNHMGKALDIHFSKKNTRVIDLIGIEEIRDKIILPHISGQIRWKDDDMFSIEPSRKSYPKEFIATTWIHIDVREFKLKYLEDKFFAKTIEETNGKNLVQLAKDLGFIDICKCMFNNVLVSNPSTIIKKHKVNHFTIEDAETALKKINEKYGKEMAKNVEMMYRWECDHFRSGQYINCGAPGMEVSQDAKGPEYGWNGELYENYPEFTPIGLWSAFENKGKSGQGGNAQVTDKQKRYIMFPSVDAGMHYVADFILRHNGNIGRWHSLDKTTQNNYIKDINSTIPRISNKF